MTATHILDGPQSGWMKVYVAGNSTAMANSLGSILNPEGVLLQITDGFLYTVVSSSGASRWTSASAPPAQTRPICAAPTISTPLPLVM